MAAYILVFDEIYTKRELDNKNHSPKDNKSLIHSCCAEHELKNLCKLTRYIINLLIEYIAET